MRVQLRRKPKIVDALGPLDEVVGFLCALSLLGLVLIAILVPLGGTAFGMERDGFCVETKDSWSLPVADKADHPFGDGLHDRASLPASTSQVCNNAPEAIDLVMVGLSNGITPLVFVGFLFLTRRTIRLAREHGLFAIALAVRVERLGRWLLFSVVAAAFVEWAARGVELGRLIEDHPWAAASFSIPYEGIVVAYIVITVGRVMARAANLQNVVDTTV